MKSYRPSQARAVRATSATSVEDQHEDDAGQGEYGRGNRQRRRKAGMNDSDRTRSRLPMFVWPLIALAVLLVGWVGYLLYLAVDGDHHPADAQLLAVRIVAGALVLTAIVLFIRRRRPDSAG